MSTAHPDLFAALAAPFRPDEIKKRKQGGRDLHYVTARTIMNRLDDVLGPENWWDRYEERETSAKCALTVRLPDGQVLTKEDVGGAAGMADSGDDDKSAVSDALKRAACKFGVGRYLYNDGVPFYAQTHAESANGHARPNGNGHARPDYRRDERKAPRPVADPHAALTNGRALFHWLKKMEEDFGVGLVNYLKGWAKLQEFPTMMNTWDADQVGLAYAEASRKLHSLRAEFGSEVPPSAN